MNARAWTQMGVVTIGLALMAAGCAGAAAAPTSAPVASQTQVAGPSGTPTSAPAATSTTDPTGTPPSSPAATATASLTATPETSPTAPALIPASGAFFSLSVADVNASAQWYVNKLGLKIVSQPPKYNGATVIVLEGDGLIVELIQQDNGVALTQVAPTIQDRTLVHGFVKAGAIIANFDQTVAALRANGVTIAYGPYPATSDQPANVIIEDNEGNLIQFFGE